MKKQAIENYLQYDSFYINTNACKCNIVQECIHNGVRKKKKDMVSIFLYSVFMWRWGTGRKGDEIRAEFKEDFKGTDNIS